MNNNFEVLNTEETPTVPMNTEINKVANDDFVDVFFDEPQQTVATDKNIVKPMTVDSLPDDEQSPFIETPIENNPNEEDSVQRVTIDSLSDDEQSPFIEAPIEGGMSEENMQDNNSLQTTIKEETNKDKLNDQIGAPIVEPEENIAKIANKDEVVSFDEFINNLSENVVGANKYISEVLEDKRILKAKEKELMTLKEKLESQEQDFREYLADQNKLLETSRKQVDDYIQGEKLRLESEIAQFKTEADATRSELVLLEENLRMKQQQLDNEKEQFEKHVKTESEIIADGHKKLENDRKQFDKEKALAQESLDNASKELKIKQEEFKQYKEFEERKLELESQNLAKSCARFKQIVAQLNSGFSQLQPKE